jgi:hypothetical protein
MTKEEFDKQVDTLERLTAEVSHYDWISFAEECQDHVLKIPADVMLHGEPVSHRDYIRSMIKMGTIAGLLHQIKEVNSKSS